MNVLDLGVWMSLQAMVDKPHHMHMCEAGALVHSMNDTWENRKLDGSTANVFKHINEVLCLVVGGRAANDLVKTTRGKKYKY